MREGDVVWVNQNPDVDQDEAKYQRLVITRVDDGVITFHSMKSMELSRSPVICAGMSIQYLRNDGERHVSKVIQITDNHSAFTRMSDTIPIRLQSGYVLRWADALFNIVGRDNSCWMDPSTYHFKPSYSPELEARSLADQMQDMVNSGKADGSNAYVRNFIASPAYNATKPSQAQVMSDLDDEALLENDLYDELMNKADK